MISWIQNTFQHHFRTVFAVLLGLIIVSFVFTIGPQSRMWGDSRGTKKMEFFGYDLTSQKDQQTIMRDAQLSVSLKYGFQMLGYIGGGQVFEHGKSRVALLHLAQQLHLPAPTAKQLEKSISEMRAFADEKGQFDAKRYAEFRDSLKKKDASFTETDVRRVMEDEYRIEEIQKIVGGPGYTLESDVASQFALAGTEWTIRVAELDYAAYAPSIKPTDEQLTKYFEDNAGLFQVGARASVDAVIFRASTFAAGAQFTEEQLNQFFEANKARFTVPATEAGKAPTPATTLASVRPQVEAAIRLAAGGQRAAKAASDFAYGIFDKKLTKSSVELDVLAKQLGGQRAVVPAFTEEDGPAGANWPDQVKKEAFRLGDERFFSDPLPLGGDQVVLLWKETLPAYKPAFAEVRAQVLAKYSENEKRKLFGESGRAWKSTLEAKLASGATFEAATNALLGAPKAEIKTPATFTRRQPPQGISPTVLKAIETLQAGQVSELLLGDESSNGNGFLVQLVARKAPVVDTNAAEYVEIRKALASQGANAFQNAVFRSLVEEAQKGYATKDVVTQ